MNTKYWTCACGKKHEVKPGQAIYCYSKGHECYRSAEYFQYRLGFPDTTKPKASKEQMSLF